MISKETGMGLLSHIDDYPSSSQRLHPRDESSSQLPSNNQKRIRDLPTFFHDKNDEYKGGGNG